MKLVEVEKKWGNEQWLENSEKYCMKLLFLDHGFQSSLHFHRTKTETFLCVAGKVLLEVMPFYKSHPDQFDVVMRHYLQPYQHFTLKAGIPHRFTAITAEAVIVEASTKHDDDDVVRIEESKEIAG
jgi:D-lyxose ketol-isomerase